MWCPLIWGFNIMKRTFVMIIAKILSFLACYLVWLSPSSHYSCNGEPQERVIWEKLWGIRVSVYTIRHSIWYSSKNHTYQVLVKVSCWLLWWVGESWEWSGWDEGEAWGCWEWSGSWNFSFHWYWSHGWFPRLVALPRDTKR